MDESYFDTLRQSMKMAGMSGAQIEQAIAAQKAAMNAYGAMDLGVMQDMAAQMQSAAGQMASSLPENLGVNMDSYFEFSEKPSINKAYQWAVACGADLAHMRGDIINDLTTGNGKETLIEVLSEQWGIDTKKDFLEMAESLKTGRHSKIYNRLAAGEKIENSESGTENLAENLAEAKKLFKKEKLIGAAAPDMYIWDLARLINLTRFTFDAGLIDRKTALACLKDAALLVKKTYKSWKDLSVAYQLGRAVWGGLDDREELEELQEGMKQLLTEEDSPWVTLPFDMKLDFEK
jgi:hypothetical protein